MFTGYFAKTATAAKVCTFFTGVLNLSSAAPAATPEYSLIGSAGTVLTTSTCSVVTGVAGAVSNTVYQVSLNLSANGSISAGESYTVLVTYQVNSLTYFREFTFSVY